MSRKRPRFEVIPPPLLDVSAMSRPAFFRAARRFNRITMRYELGSAVGNINYSVDLIRSFGFTKYLTSEMYPVRAFYAFATGRLQYIQRAFLAALNRRRRQAYLLLRRALPVELVRMVQL